MTLMAGQEEIDPAPFRREEIMKCPRCQGFVIHDQIWSPTDDLGMLPILRCLNCGETLEDGIIRNRQKPEIVKPFTAAKAS